MQAPALCFTLVILQFIVLKAQVQSSQKGSFLRIIPNKVQHFQQHSLSFNCVGFKGLVQLREMKNNKGPVSFCKINRTSAGFSCSVNAVYLEDSGEYWCETTQRKRSNSVNVTVTAGPVILESPAFPVSEGDNVILRCRNKTNPTKLQGFFYKDGMYLRDGAAGEMTIRNVSKSDEGMYKCSISGVGRSLESWLSVRAPDDDTFSEDHESPHSFISLWVLLSILMVVVVLLLVLHVWRKKVSGDENTEDLSSVMYSTVDMKPSNREDAGHNLSLEADHSRKPQTETAGSGSSLNPSSSVEQEIIYSVVKTVTQSGNNFMDDRRDCFI